MENFLFCAVLANGTQSLKLLKVILLTPINNLLLILIMAAVFMTNAQINVFDQRIVHIIMNSKRKCMDANLKSIHSDIVKAIYFKDIPNNIFRIESNTLIIKEKIINTKSIWASSLLMIA